LGLFHSRAGIGGAGSVQDLEKAGNIPTDQDLRPNSDFVTAMVRAYKVFSRRAPYLLEQFSNMRRILSFPHSPALRQAQPA